MTERGSAAAAVLEIPATLGTLAPRAASTDARERAQAVVPEELGILEAISLGFKVLSLGACVMTGVSMMLLGPFGFFPVFLLIPFVLLGDVTGWLGRRLKESEPRARHEDVSALQEAEAAPAPPPPEQPKNFARVQQTLPGLLDTLEKERNLVELMKLLRSLRILLEEHFADEEAPGALFDELRALEPRAGFEVDAFEADHTRILADLDELIGRYGNFRTRLQTARHGQIRTTRRELLAELRAHQRAESQLIQAVYGIRFDDEAAPSAEPTRRGSTPGRA